MGLLDLFARDVDCPRCGTPGARQGLFGGVSCPNRGCDNYSPRQMHERLEMPLATPPRDLSPVPAGDFDAGVHRIAVRYRNHRDEHKTFGGDRRTLRRRGRHISLNVEPTGRRIALAANRIQNLDEVESALGRLPTPREAQVLVYHTRRGTTSERYEALRQKYPDWSPYK